MDENDNLIRQVDGNKRQIAAQLLTEIEFMRSTLAKLREEIELHGVVEDFKQGKQEFTRESPALKSYNTTIARFATLQKQLVDLLPDGVAEQGDELDAFLFGE